MGYTGGIQGVYRGYTGVLVGDMARLKRARRGDRLETRGVGPAGGRVAQPGHGYGAVSPPRRERRKVPKTCEIGRPAAAPQDF